LAIAFSNTSCTFIIRSISLAEYCWQAFTSPALPTLFSKRTDHV
jgi:hypothetical protein